MSKKKNHNYKSKKQVQPKNKKKAPVIIAISAALALTAIIILIVVFTSNPVQNELKNTSWTASSANNASGDEVEMSEVYESKYTSYQGSMSFSDDGTFTFWLSPGNPDDGTHSGKYTLEDENTISAQFDSGEASKFRLNREAGKLTSITVDYNGYEVVFVKS